MKILNALCRFVDFVFDKVIMSIFDLIVLTLCMVVVLISVIPWPQEHWLTYLVILLLGVLGGGMGTYQAITNLVKTWKRKVV